MIRILFLLAVIFALGLGFSWLADRPGTMVVTFDGIEYQLTLLVAAVAIVSVVAAVMLLWWVLRAIWTSPRAAPVVARRPPRPGRAARRPRRPATPPAIRPAHRPGCGDAAR